MSGRRTDAACAGPAPPIPMTASALPPADANPPAKAAECFSEHCGALFYFRLESTAAELDPQHDWNSRTAGAQRLPLRARFGSRLCEAPELELIVNIALLNQQ